MAKYLIVGDLHLADRPPSMCTDTYTDDLFVLLEHTVRLETELGLDGVIWAGDCFHHKQPSRTSHKLMQRTIELVQQYRRLWLVLGNHDLLNDRLGSAFETQPVGVLLKAGAQLLSGWEATGEHPIYGVPWLQRHDEAGVREALTDWRAVPSAQRGSSLVVAHAPLYPPGQELPFEYYPTKDEEDRAGWSALMGNAGSCYYGHVHEAHGVFVVDGVTYANQGALSRGSLAESELARAVAVTVWDSERAGRGAGFSRVEVPHRPSSEVFRLTEAAQTSAAAVELTDFLASVGQTSLEITSIEAVIEALRGMGLDPEVVSTATELVRMAGA